MNVDYWFSVVTAVNDRTKYHDFFFFFNLGTTMKTI